MRLTRTAALVVAALVVGLVAGNVVTGFAAPSAAATQSATGGLGLRLGAAMRDAGGRLVDVVAGLTGLDADAVQEQRADGTSFADIAAAKDVSSQQVVDAALDVREQVLSERVAAGAISQEQADVALERMESRLAERVASTDAAACGGAGAGGGGGACGGGMGAGGGACGGGMGAGRGACTQAPAVSQ